MTFKIVEMSTVKGRGGAGSGAVMKESEEGEGCFALRASRVTVLCSANPSSLLTSLTAPLELPSSSLLETLDARSSVLLRFEVDRWYGAPQRGWIPETLGC